MHELFAPVSKWVATIEDGSQVSSIIRRAFMHLRTGRPGPVVIGMPYDVSSMDVGNFEYAAVTSKPKVRSGADPQSVEAAVKALAACVEPPIFTSARASLTSEATPRTGPVRGTPDASRRDDTQWKERGFRRIIV